LVREYVVLSTVKRGASGGLTDPSLLIVIIWKLSPFTLDGKIQKPIRRNRTIRQTVTLFIDPHSTTRASVSYYLWKDP